jgi:hypothetical protein
MSVCGKTRFREQTAYNESDFQNLLSCLDKSEFMDSGKKCHKCVTRIVSHTRAQSQSLMTAHYLSVNLFDLSELMKGSLHPISILLFGATTDPEGRRGSRRRGPSDFFRVANVCHDVPRSKEGKL